MLSANESNKEFKRSRTNRIIVSIAYFIVFGSILAAMVVVGTLTTVEPGYENTFYTATIPDPMRWYYAFIIILGGITSSLGLFATSEVLTRLQNIEYHSLRR